MKVILTQDILKTNEDKAKKNKKIFKEHGVFVFNLISSPGSGKTTFLQKSIELLKPYYSIGVIEGDVFTAKDAEKIEEVCENVIQLNTRGGCHLDANMIAYAVQEFKLEDLDIIFIENVGNLVCPSEFDLGEDVRITILSVAEGDDKPEKYPFAFQGADAVIINKTDLIPYTNFNLSYATEQIDNLKPGMRIFEISTPRNEGYEAWIDYVRQIVSACLK